MSQGNEFSAWTKNCNRVSNTYEKWKSVPKFGTKILNCLKTIQCSILKRFKEITLPGEFQSYGQLNLFGNNCENKSEITDLLLCKQM